jgi:hypothetical protein
VLADRLAAESDRVADAIEANDGCAAADRAAKLLTAAAAAPEQARQEIERIARREFVCLPAPPPPEPQPPPPPPPLTTEDEGDEDDDKGKKDKRKKKKKDKRHEHEADE